MDTAMIFGSQATMKNGGEFVYCYACFLWNSYENRWGNEMKTVLYNTCIRRSSDKGHEEKDEYP